MKPPAKRGLWIVLATLVAVGIVALVVSRPWGQAPGPRLPAFDAADVSQRDSTGILVTNHLNSSVIPRLRWELEAAKRVRGEKWVGAGTIGLRQAGAEVQQVDLFWDGAGLTFRVGEEYYRPPPGGLLHDVLDTSKLPRSSNR